MYLRGNRVKTTLLFSVEYGVPQGSVSVRLFSCMTQCRTTTAATERAAAIIHTFMCWSTQILDAMNQDSRVPLTQLQVDGGMTSNRLLMQLQADILCTTVGRHVHTRSGRRGSTKPPEVC